MTINAKKTVTSTSSHKNFMDGTSFDVKNPLTRLRMAAASSFFGEPQYYIDGDSSKKTSTPFSYITESTLEALFPDTWRGKTSAQIMEQTIDEALEYDAELTLKLASDLRNEDFIRVTPQVILVRAAHHSALKGTGLVRKWAPAIIKRADEPATGLAYHLSRYGKNTPVPNSLKKAWRTALEGFNEYQLAKYRMENRVVKTVDVVNLVHPRRTTAINKLVRGELKLSTEDTWEALISKKGSNTATWTEAVDVMGHMALLRNLRNLLTHSVSPVLFNQKLINGVADGKQLPFRYFSAYKAIEDTPGSGSTKDALEQCLMASIENLPRLPGRSAVLCDNSGSAQKTTTSSLGTMKVSTIANLTGVLVGKCSDEATVGIFGDKLTMFEVRKKTSVFDDVNKMEEAAKHIGQGTENGIWLFLDDAIRNKTVYNNIFIMSDMQAGHGGLYGVNPEQYANYRYGSSRNIDVNKLINAYRSKVNPDVNVFLVQVAGYHDTLMPEFYKKTYILGGWSEGIIKFASKINTIVQ